MKALVSKSAGGPETLVLEELPSLTPQPGQVVVQVKACGVNFPDVLIIEDRYQYKPERPFSPGGEVSGVVKLVGEGVTRFKPGDRVLGNGGWGGMAEELAIDAERLTLIPDSMAHDEAAAYILTYGTAYYALHHRGHIKPGESLLVLGAAGGVGLAAVALGKAMGARVIAAASSEEKVALARRHGADETLVYPPGPFDKDASKALAAQFKTACGEHGADVIYDAVGGDYSEPALRSIAWEGRFLIIGFPAGIAKIPLNLPLLKGCDILGVFWGESVARDRVRHRKDLEALMELYTSGKVKPYVSERFPLARGGEAIAHLSARKAMGKVVVTME